MMNIFNIMINNISYEEYIQQPIRLNPNIATFKVLKPAITTALNSNPNN
jgi:hypothetical protein